MSLYGPIRLALTRPMARSFELALQQHAPSVPIDRLRAEAQHEAYSRTLRGLCPEVVEVSANEEFPDCCFIEDTAIVVGSDVIITRIGAQSRRGESDAVRAAFALMIQSGHDFTLHDLKHPACLDGGDVLQMGQWVFVGLSERTNAAAIHQLEQILPGRIVTVPVAAGLHLKSLLSAADDRTLIAAASPAGRSMAEQILKQLQKAGSATCSWVPDPVAANVVRLGSHLLIQAGWPQSQAILQSLAVKMGLTIVPLDMSELCKADGALTCCSILIP